MIAFSSGVSLPGFFNISSGIADLADIVQPCAAGNDANLFVG